MQLDRHQHKVHIDWEWLVGLQSFKTATSKQFAGQQQGSSSLQAPQHGSSTTQCYIISEARHAGQVDKYLWLVCCMHTPEVAVCLKLLSISQQGAAGRQASMCKGLQQLW
jgi:hypothetical protein